MKLTKLSSIPHVISIATIVILTVSVIYNQTSYLIVNKNYNTSESKRVKAFLDTISWAETGTIDPSSYKALVFNGHFNSFASHPMIKQCALIEGKMTCSYAAGRYQIMNYEWDRFKPRLNLPDFSPESQDKIAIELIKEKNALSDVESGNFEKAACKVGSVWASFPCNSYGQHPRAMQELKTIYYQQLKKEK